MALGAKITHLSHSSSIKFLAVFFIAILGLIVQMQITPELGGTKVRFNLADPVIAILMPLVLYVTLSNWRAMNKQLGWHVLVLFVCATMVFSYAYAIGYLKIGFFAWATVKYIGWYALMSYFAVGVFSTAVLGSAGQKIFALAFFGACVFSSLIQILHLYFFRTSSYFSLTRLEGFTGNPNAFGFVLICGFVLGLVYSQAISSRIFKGSTELLSAVVLAGIYFTGSISALLTTVVIFGVLLVGIVSWRQLAVILSVALVIVFTPNILGITTAEFTTTVLENKIYSNMNGGTKENTVYYQTIGVRMDVMWQGFELWKQSPIFGTGLGVHFFQQQSNLAEGKAVVLVHNTGIWLLAGTGLVGFLVFVLLFSELTRKMWSGTRIDTKTKPSLRSGNFASAALVCMVAWLFMSLFHELMYQRVIWLIAGIAVWPVVNIQNSDLEKR